jgi:hypothetical protein
LADKFREAALPKGWRRPKISTQSFVVLSPLDAVLCISVDIAVTAKRRADASEDKVAA